LIGRDTPYAGAREERVGDEHRAARGV
jgi:hypothetical protein